MLHPKLYLLLIALGMALQTAAPGQTIEQINYRGIDEPNRSFPNQVEYTEIHHHETDFHKTKLIERYQSLRFLKPGYEIPNNLLDSYRVSELARIRKDLAPTAKNLNPADPKLRVIEMDFRLIHLDSSSLGIIVHTHVYAGGAYGAIRHRAFNFKKDVGGWKQYEPLTDLDPTKLREQIQDHINEKGLNGDYFTKTWPDVTDPETRPFSAIELPDEYYLLFQRYTIATGDRGSITIRLPKSSMAQQ